MIGEDFRSALRHHLRLVLHILPASSHEQRCPKSGKYRNPLRDTAPDRRAILCETSDLCSLISGPAKAHQ
jgi:hypothetical protein